MEEIAEVYARALFEVAKEHDKLDRVRDELGQFADALEREPRPAGVLLLALLLDGGEEGRAARRDRRTPTRRSSTSSSCCRAPPHAGDLPHPREFERLWAEENKLLPVDGHQRGRARRALR